MPRVKFTDNRGRITLIDERVARLLESKRRGTYEGSPYMTRELVPQQAAPVDAAGVLWSSELHTADMGKKKDGTWRLKPGRKAEHDNEQPEEGAE